MSLSGVFRSFARKGPLVYPNYLFGVPGLFQPSDLPRIASERVETATQTMRHWLESPSAGGPAVDIQLLDDVSNSLCSIADAAEFIRNVDDNDEWVSHATSAVELVSDFMNSANLSTEYYTRAHNILKLGQKESSLSIEELNVIKSMVEAMRNEGVSLESAEKNRLIELQARDVRKSFEIVQKRDSATATGTWVRISDPNKFHGILPQRTQGGNDEFLIPHGHPELLMQLFKETPCRNTRQLIWEVSNNPSGFMRSKEDAIQELIETRRELAQLRGYKSWNEYAQRESILSPLGGPRAVQEFLKDLWIDLGDGLEREMSELVKLNGGKQVEPWDVDYLTTSWKRSNPQAVRATEIIQSQLNFKRIVEGSQKILRQVLGVALEYDPTVGHLWHPTATRLSLSRAKGQPFAYLYLDPYERATKSVHSAQFTISGSKVFTDGTRQLPQTAIVLSLPSRPSSTLPIPVAQTFFHEMGHAMHSLMSETSLQHFSGSRGAIDFVEFPSHLFEYFATEPECLRLILNGSVDDSCIMDYSGSRNPFAHLEVAQQLMYALLDQVYYSCGNLDSFISFLPEARGVDNERMARLLLPTSVANFEHLIHYGGSYYAYLLCRTIAAHIWDKSFRENPWNRESGAKLETFLKRGSVDQSLSVIFELLPNASDRRPVAIDRQAFLRDLRTCTAIHNS
jgi:intermediate peptidase